MVALVALLLVGAVPAPLSASDLYKRAAPSVVVLVARNEKEKDRISQGSGVVLGPRTIVTNWHVVESARFVLVKTAAASGKQTGEVGVALLVGEDSVRDLAVLRLLDLKVGSKGTFTPGAPPMLTPARVSKRGLEVGQRVFAIGSPRGLELSLSDGLVAQLRDDGEKGRLIQTTAAISHGSSGGGLFDERAELVGFTTLSLESGQNLNFAVPAQAALALLARGFSARGAQRLCAVPADLRAEFLKQFDTPELQGLAKLQAQFPCKDEGAGDDVPASVAENRPPQKTSEPAAEAVPPRADVAPRSGSSTSESRDASQAEPVVQAGAPVEPVVAPPPMPPLLSSDTEPSSLAPQRVSLEPAPESTVGTPRRLAWIPAVTAGGLLAAGGVFFGLAKGAESSLRNPVTQIANEAEADRVLRAGRDYQTTSFLLFGSGLVFAATAGAMYIFSPPTNAPSVSLLVAPTGFAVGVGGALP